jgi:hypothetical protein
MPIDVDQFIVATATLEVRYSSAFLMWDRAGSVWDAVKERYPTITVQDAQPNQLTAALAIDKSLFSVTRPKNDLRELQTFGKVFFPALFDHLHVEVPTRVGLRVVYAKMFDKRDEAASFISQHSAMPKPRGKHLNVDGKLLDPDVAIRYETDKLGFSVRLKATEQTLSATFPPEFRDLQPPKAVRNVVNLDVDYYAHGSTAVAAFDHEAIIDGWLHLIRRDIGKVFSG